MKLNLGGSSAQSEGEGGTVELYTNARVFRTPSGSRQGKFHFTVYSDTGGAMCTCEGFQYRGKCKHIETANRIMAALDAISPPATNVDPVGSVGDKDPFDGLPED